MSNTLRASICYIMALLTFVLIRILSCYGVFSGFTGVIGDLKITLIIQIICLIIVPFTCYRLLSHSNIENDFHDFGYRPIKLKTVILCFILGIIGYIFNLYISSLWNFILAVLGYTSRASSNSGIVYNNITDLFIMLFSTAVLPAVGEEFLHRGLMQSNLQKDKSIVFSAVTTGLLFGLFHLNIYQTGYASFLGIIMGLVVIFSKSIYPAMIMHFTNNAINVLISYFYGRSSTVKTILNALEKFINTRMLLCFFISIIVLMLLYFVFYIIVVAIMKNELKELEKFSFNDIALTILNMGEKKKKKKEIYSQQVLFVNSEDEKDREHFSEINNILKNLFNSDKTKLEFKDYIVLITIFVLSAIITFFTFVWGIL